MSKTSEAIENLKRIQAELSPVRKQCIAAARVLQDLQEAHYRLAKAENEARKACFDAFREESIPSLPEFQFPHELLRR